MEVEIDLAYCIIIRIIHTAVNNVDDKEWWRAMNETRCLRDDFSVAEPTVPITIVFNTTYRAENSKLTLLHSYLYGYFQIFSYVFCSQGA